MRHDATATYMSIYMEIHEFGAFSSNMRKILGNYLDISLKILTFAAFQINHI